MWCERHGCLVTECREPGRTWYPQREVDYAEMALAAANADYEALHEKAPWHDGTFTDWAPQRSPSHPFHFRDGVTIYVSQTDVNPGDLFTTKVNASPAVKPDANAEGDGAHEDAQPGDDAGADS